MDIQWIVAPLVGCIIGYITNSIAIKMLFRPHDAVKIGRFTLPFTPGLIPRNRGRLAAAIGDVISRELLNVEVVEETLLSSGMNEKLSMAIDGGVKALRQDESTVGETIARYAGEENLENWIGDARQGLVTLMHEKLNEADLGGIAARAIVDYALKRSPSALSGLVSSLLDEKRRHSITAQLREGVNQYVDENAEPLIGKALDGGVVRIRSMRVCDLVEKYEDKLPAVKAKLMDAYAGLIRAGTRRALEAVDIAGIVRERIETFDSRTIEKLVFSIMHRELNAIIWLGALLGFFMGFTNLLF